MPNHYPEQKNFNKWFTVLGWKFQFSAQDRGQSDLEYLCWRCKNSQVSSDFKATFNNTVLKSL